jgi:outer membrane immunogenic protein
MDMVMKALAPVATGVAMLIGGALAAQAEGGYDWTGFHVGVQGGFLNGTASTTGALTGESRFCFIGCTPWAPFDFSETGMGTFAGVATGGVSVGYNHQFGQFVLGAEADINRTNATISPPGALISILGGAIEIGSWQTDLDWFGSARAKLGYAVVEGVMVYGTGGLAFGNVTNDIGFSVGAIGDTFSATDLRYGYTIGGGVEMKLAPTSPWSVKAEALFTDLGEADFMSFDLPNIPIVNRNNMATGSNALSFSTFRIGVNYAF